MAYNANKSVSATDFLFSVKKEERSVLLLFYSMIWAFWIGANPPIESHKFLWPFGASAIGFQISRLATEWTKGIFFVASVQASASLALKS